MMTLQSDRYTKPVFLGFLLTVFDFGFFQELPQPMSKCGNLTNSNYVQHGQSIAETCQYS